MSWVRAIAPWWAAILVPGVAHAGGSLVLEGVKPGAEVIVDGRKIDNPAVTIPADTGVHVVELRAPPRIRIKTVSVEDAKASHLALASLDDGARKSSAVLSLEGAASKLARLSIDGGVVHDALAGKFTEIWIDQGEHRLEVEDLNASKRAIGVRFDAGSEVSLLELFTTVAPIGVTDSGEIDETGSAGTWKALAMIATGAGAAAGVIGTVLIIQAQDSRDVIREAPVEDGHKVGISMREAWLVESDARTDSAIGAILIGGGAALITGAVIYWLGGD